MHKIVYRSCGNTMGKIPRDCVESQHGYHMSPVDTTPKHSRDSSQPYLISNHGQNLYRCPWPLLQGTLGTLRTAILPWGGKALRKWQTDLFKGAWCGCC